MTDPFDLQRFVAAQDPVFEHVLSELRNGSKRGHWIWFVFPQLRGLGRSPMADQFGISAPEEAAAYLRHATLGPRLTECLDLVSEVEGRSATDIFGQTDALKFRSCITLFQHVAPDREVFADLLKKFYAGVPDPLTLARLGEGRPR